MRRKSFANENQIEEFVEKFHIKNARDFSSKISATPDDMRLEYIIEKNNVRDKLLLRFCFVANTRKR